MLILRCIALSLILLFCRLSPSSLFGLTAELWISSAKPVISPKSVSECLLNVNHQEQKTFHLMYMVACFVGHNSK